MTIGEVQRVKDRWYPQIGANFIMSRDVMLVARHLIVAGTPTSIISRLLDIPASRLNHKFNRNYFRDYGTQVFNKEAWLLMDGHTRIRIHTERKKIEKTFEPGE